MVISRFRTSWIKMLAGMSRFSRWPWVYVLSWQQCTEWTTQWHYPALGFDFWGFDQQPSYCAPSGLGARGEEPDTPPCQKQTFIWNFFPQLGVIVLIISFISLIYGMFPGTFPPSHHPTYHFPKLVGDFVETKVSDQVWRPSPCRWFPHHWPHGCHFSQ